ncbi:MAG: DF family (seleno)protein [Chloroflexota bacterium]
MQIEFLYSDDCPSHERALQLLHQVLSDEGAEADIAIHQVETDEQAQAVRFPGSPTIRINGADIDAQRDNPIGLACRTYIRGDGRVSPLPGRELIVDAVRRALAKAS